MVNPPEVIDRATNLVTAGSNLVMAINELSEKRYHEMFWEWLENVRKEAEEFWTWATGVSLLPRPPECPEGMMIDPLSGECVPTPEPPTPVQYTGLEQAPTVSFVQYHGTWGTAEFKFRYHHNAYLPLIAEGEYIRVPAEGGPQAQFHISLDSTTSYVQFPILNPGDTFEIRLDRIQNLLTGVMVPVLWVYKQQFWIMQRNCPWRPCQLQPSTWQVK